MVLQSVAVLVLWKDRTCGHIIGNVPLQNGSIDIGYVVFHIKIDGRLSIPVSRDKAIAKKSRRSKSKRF